MLYKHEKQYYQNFNLIINVETNKMLSIGSRGNSKYHTYMVEPKCLIRSTDICETALFPLGMGEINFPPPEEIFLSLDKYYLIPISYP